MHSNLSNNHDLAVTPPLRGFLSLHYLTVLSRPDAGYALCVGGFVLATPDTCFRVLNPSKGLSFDPIGLSFVLPRLGWEFKQRSAEYTGCGLLHALTTGMEANASDSMETGIATHFVDNVNYEQEFDLNDDLRLSLMPLPHRLTKRTIW